MLNCEWAEFHMNMVHLHMYFIASYIRYDIFFYLPTLASLVILRTDFPIPPSHSR